MQNYHCSSNSYYALPIFLIQIPVTFWLVVGISSGNIKATVFFLICAESL